MMSEGEEDIENIGNLLSPDDVNEIDAALEDLLKENDFGVDSDEEIIVDVDPLSDERNNETVICKNEDIIGDKAQLKNKEEVLFDGNVIESNQSLAEKNKVPPIRSQQTESPLASDTSTSSSNKPSSTDTVFHHPFTDPLSLPDASAMKTNLSSAFTPGSSTVSSFPSVSSMTSTLSSMWNNANATIANIPTISSALSKEFDKPTNQAHPTERNLRNVQVNENHFQQQTHETNIAQNDQPESPGSIVPLLMSHVDSLLPGERIIMFLYRVKKVYQSSNPIPTKEGVWWCCVMTFYRVMLFPQINVDEENNNTEKKMSWWKGGGCWETNDSRGKRSFLIEMPLASIDWVEKVDDEMDVTNPYTSSGSTLTIHGKDNNRFIRFTTSTNNDSVRAFQTLQTYAFPGRRNLGYLFAFESRRSEVMSPNHSIPPTECPYNFQKEFEDRLKILPSMHYAKIENIGYSLCGSYPKFLVVPRACVNDLEGRKVLQKCAAFRSEHRLPALTWASSNTSAGIWRCSQPKVGIQGNRSLEDEKYLRLMSDGIQSHPCRLSLIQRLALTGGEEGTEKIESILRAGNVESLKMRILDLRSKAAAMANRGTGYGYESSNNYPTTSLSFCNITNIHGVRDAYNKISQLCLSSNVNDYQWGSLVEDSKWLYHIRLILQASWITAYHIHYNNLPILVHCSHGWDRTSQVAAIGQILLDPFYRTMKGFATLVEKDFLSFGHPLHTRGGHGEGKGERGTNASGHGGEGQVAPIFIQFLDCVYQLVYQFPNWFEFNSRYVLVISEHVYSCRFGTLLCDNEKEREVDAKIRLRTHCMWKHLEDCSDFLKNPLYGIGKKEVLIPPLPLLLRNVVIWFDRHLKWSPKPSWIGVSADLRPFLYPLSTLTSNDDRKAPENVALEKEKLKHMGEDVMAMPSSMDIHRAQLNKEIFEKEHWKRLAEEKERELLELKKELKEKISK